MTYHETIDNLMVEKPKMEKIFRESVVDRSKIVEMATVCRMLYYYNKFQDTENWDYLSETIITISNWVRENPKQKTERDLKKICPRCERFSFVLSKDCSTCYECGYEEISGRKIPTLDYTPARYFRDSIIETYKPGMTAKTVARLTGASVATVKKYIPTKKNNNDMANYIKKMHSDGYSFAEISRMVDLTENVVKKYYNKNLV